MAAQMSFNEFEHSLARSAHPPTSLNAPLRALWLDAKGDWHGAHALAQVEEGDDRAGAWVHAYLHRKEGDEANAAYWYARSGRPVATGDLGLEWREMVKELLRSVVAD